MRDLRSCCSICNMPSVTNQKGWQRCEEHLDDQKGGSAIEAEMRFASASSSLTDNIPVTVKLEIDAVDFDDLFGSWLGGPWKVLLIPLDKKVVT